MLNLLLYIAETPFLCFERQTKKSTGSVLVEMGYDDMLQSNCIPK